MAQPQKDLIFQDLVSVEETAEKIKRRLNACLAFIGILWNPEIDGAVWKLRITVGVFSTL
jgi:hypothetical protein